MDHFFAYQSAYCYYRTEGEGIAVLFVHGFAEDHTVWNRQVEFLKEYCQVITPDLPGSGNSEVIHYPLMLFPLMILLIIYMQCCSTQVLINVLCWGIVWGGI